MMGEFHQWSASRISTWACPIPDINQRFRQRSQELDAKVCR